MSGGWEWLLGGNDSREEVILKYKNGMIIVRLPGMIIDSKNGMIIDFTAGMILATMQFLDLKPSIVVNF